jgi:ankyrin repeat protein
MDVETSRMQDLGRDAHRAGPALHGRMSVGFIVVLLSAAVTACVTMEAPGTIPPASKALALPGFRVSPPPGRGWKGEADRASRTATFSKKYGGLLRAMIDEQHRAEVFVTPLFVPPELWSTVGPELTSALKNDDVANRGLASALGWLPRPLPGRLVEYRTREGFIDATEEDTGLDSFSEEPQFKEKVLDALYLPPDLEVTHRYFEVRIVLTEIDGLLPLHDDTRLALLDAVVSNLQTIGPFDHLKGPMGDLARAVLAGDAEALRTALDQGAAADAQLPDWTPVEMAALCDRRDIGGLIGRDGGVAAILGVETALTPFLLALLADKPDIAALLLEKTDPPGAATPAGPPPLVLAAGLGAPAVVAALLGRGADVDARAAGGRTPLMLASESGSLECVGAIVDAGAGLDLQAEDGGTALMTAVDWGRKDVMRSLIGAGADVNIQDNDGWSCLLVAIFQGDAGLAGELIAAGADVNANVFATGQTALLQAIEGDKFEIADLLVAAGADVNRHKDGQPTPLMAAAAKGRAELVRLLIGQGADVNVRTDDRRTALSIAEAGGQTAVAGILLKAGAKR